MDRPCGAPMVAWLAPPMSSVGAAGGRRAAVVCAARPQRGLLAMHAATSGSAGEPARLGEVWFVEIGTGTDLHGQDVTKAAVRACQDAIRFNSLPGLTKLLPTGDVNTMRVRVTLGVPEPYVGQVDLVQVRAVFPYGTVFPAVRPGGLLCGAGISFPDRGDRDGDDTIIIVNAVVEVGY